MIGRVFRSFSAFMVLITPSILQGRRRLQVTKKPQQVMLFQHYYTASRGHKEHQPMVSSTTAGISQAQEAVNVLPSFHFGEVNCYKSIWKCFFIQVSAISPNEGRHIVAYKLRIYRLDILKRNSFLQVLFKNYSTNPFCINLHKSSTSPAQSRVLRFTIFSLQCSVTASSQLAKIRKAFIEIIRINAYNKKCKARTKQLLLWCSRNQTENTFLVKCQRLL